MESHKYQHIVLVMKSTPVAFSLTDAVVGPPPTEEWSHSAIHLQE